MSEVEGQTTSQAEQQVDVNQLLERVKTLEASKERILEESKGYKAKFQEATGKLEQINTKQLEEQGNYEQLLKQAREDNARLSGELETSRKNNLLSNIRTTVSNKAPNVRNLDLLMRTDEAKLIQYDEETMEVDLNSVETFLATSKEKNPFLFEGKKIASQAAGTPANDGESTIPAKPLKKLSDDELEAMILKK